MIAGLFSDDIVLLILRGAHFEARMIPFLCHAKKKGNLQGGIVASELCILLPRLNSWICFSPCSRGTPLASLKCSSLPLTTKYESEGSVLSASQGYSIHVATQH